MEYQIDQGTFQERIFPFLLRDISNEHLSGMLSIKYASRRKALFFEKGEIIFTQSSLPEEQLGEYMLRGGVYDDEQYGLVLDIVRRAGWNSPQINSLNFISQTTINWWLKTLIRQVVNSLMTLHEGSYKFLQNRMPPESSPVVVVETLNLVFSCVRQIHDAMIILQWLGDLECVPRIDQKTLNQRISALNLTPQEGFFLSRVDGHLNFRQLISLAGPQRHDMIRFFVGGILTGLIITGKAQSYLAKTVKIKLPDEIVAPRQEQSVPVAPVKQEKQTVTTKIDDVKKDENTEDISLTDEELKEIARLGGKIKSMAGDIFFSSDRENLQEMEQVDLTAKLSYLREGEFVEASDGNDAVDIDKLKSESELTGRKYTPEGKMTLLLGDEEVDADENLLGFSSAQDIFSTDNADEQWNRWMMITIEEDDLEYLENWDETWKSWEEQYDELKTLRDHRKKTSDEIQITTDREKTVSLQKRVTEIDRAIERLVVSKKREILRAFRGSQLQNYYELLHVPTDASTGQIKEAYFKWLKEYQLDERFAEEFAQLKEPLDRLNEKLHQAYEVLSDDINRLKYDTQLEEQHRNAENIARKKRQLAEEHFESSRLAVKRGDTMLAMRFLRASLSLDPHKPEYYSEMARILGKNPQWGKEALRFYHRAFHLKQDDPGLLQEVASLSMKLNLFQFAEKALQQAIHLDPNNAKTLKLISELKKSNPD